MQTTLRIDDELYREAKVEAARQGMTLTNFLQEGLRLRIQKGRSTSSELPSHFRTYRKGESFRFTDKELKDIANQELDGHSFEDLKVAEL